MTKRLLILLAVCVVFVGGAQAATVFERLGDPLTDWSLGGVSNQILATSWFQNFASSGTQIDVFGVQPAGATAVHFALMKGGPTGSLVSSVDISFDPSNGPGNYTLFSGAFLDPGTYVIVASILGADETTAGTWTGLDSGVPSFQQITDFGAQAGAGAEYFSFTGSSGFVQTELDLGFSVTGLESAVPEPATCSLLLVGLAVAVLNRKRLARRG
jgi:hypothetical protein